MKAHSDALIVNENIITDFMLLLSRFKMSDDAVLSPLLSSIVSHKYDNIDLVFNRYRLEDRVVTFYFLCTLNRMKLNRVHLNKSYEMLYDHSIYITRCTDFFGSNDDE